MAGYDSGTAVGTIIIGGILAIAGTIWSGYHFIDDHELLRIEYEARNGNPLSNVLRGWLVGDMTWRYRPLYWIERVILGYLFGSNLTAWNIWTAVKGILAFALLYESARYLKFGRIVSTIFPMIIVLGAQFTPWYRSANQESTGILFLRRSIMPDCSAGIS